MGEEDKKTWLDLIETPPRTPVIVIFIILIAISLKFPMGLPLAISPRVRALYTHIESLSENDVVLYLADNEAGLHGETGPGSGATLTHLLRRGVKLVFVSFNPAGMMLNELGYEYGWSERPEEYGYVYGEDYVELGYMTGMETGMANIASDIHSAYGEDMYGTPIDELPMMADIHNANDFTFVMQCDTNTGLCESMVRQWAATYPHIKIGWVVGAGMEVAQMPYYPDPAIGIVGGIRGGAEYEGLIKRPRRGSKFTDILSITQVYALILIIGGNIAYAIRKKTIKEEGRSA